MTKDTPNLHRTSPQPPAYEGTGNSPLSRPKPNLTSPRYLPPTDHIPDTRCPHAIHPPLTHPSPLPPPPRPPAPLLPRRPCRPPLLLLPQIHNARLARNHALPILRPLRQQHVPAVVPPELARIRPITHSLHAREPRPCYDARSDGEKGMYTLLGR